MRSRRKRDRDVYGPPTRWHRATGTAHGRLQAAARLSLHSGAVDMDTSTVSVPAVLDDIDSSVVCAVTVC